MKADSIEIKAYAKVNLTLDVLGKRPDGYHELEGIMQEISLFDEVRVEKAEGLEVRFDEPVPERNTCRTAAELYLGSSGLGAHIDVKKHIPSEAGLGGASADAAAVLRGLNALYGLRTEAELFGMGLRVGADVPFCLMGGCAIARGVGERLVPIRGMELDLLVVRGSRGVSTGRLFASLGPSDIRPEGGLGPALAAIEGSDIAALGSCLKNALQAPACGFAPEIAEYAARMRSLGALGASMTGSGAAVFGIFRSKEDAETACRAFSDCEFRAVCRTIRK